MSKTEACLIAFVFLCLSFVFSRPHAAEPPMIVVLEADANANAANGQSIAVPGPSTVNACAENGIVAEYVPATRSFHVLKPCASMFNDGFE